MRKFWLLDQHGGDGPTALVETDGRLQIVDIVRFGPSVSDLEAQQDVWDRVIGRVAPTLKPCVSASSVDEEGIMPLAELERGDDAGSGSANRSARRKGTPTKAAIERSSGGPSRNRSRGER